MESRKVLPRYEIFDGMRLFSGISYNAYQSCLKYQPKPDDLFIVTYPKCGTTWTQSIVLHILRKGEPLKCAADFFQASPFLEMTGADAVDMMIQPGAIKLHLPYDLTPYSDKAKYIYVARNPKDCCVSFYHHTKTLSVYGFEDGNFDDYFDLFLKGEVDYNDYFDHLLSWYKHRDDPNVLFLTYEDMKKSRRDAVFKIAEFIGEEYAKMLDYNPDILVKILHYTSVDYMKKHINKFTEDYWNGNMPEDSPLPSGIKEFFANVESRSFKKGVKGFLVRKGVVGDWKNHFSPEQERRMEEWIKEKTAGSDVMKLWE